jgi:hypothetical protein
LTKSLLFRDVQSTLNSDVGKIDQLDPNDLAPVSLKSQFKDIFLNISEVMDCISCQKCKLHGKLQLLGLGTALKVLLLPEDLLASSLNQQEVVALVNTIAKFSHAIRSVPDLLNAARQEALKGESDFVVDSDATRDEGLAERNRARSKPQSRRQPRTSNQESSPAKLRRKLSTRSWKMIQKFRYSQSITPNRCLFVSVEHALRALGLPPLATSGCRLSRLTSSLSVVVSPV